MIRTSKIMIHYKILVSYDVVKSEEIPEAQVLDDRLR